MVAALPWRSVVGGVDVAVLAKPRSAQDGVDGIERLDDGTAWLRVRIRALPEDGKANDAITLVLAKALGVPRGQVDLVAGGGARRKRFRITGDAAALVSALERLVS